MQVRSGWNSSPYGRKKMDVELGEPDLVRVLTEHGLDPAVAAAMPSGHAFKVLWCEAEILSRYAMLRHMTSGEEGQGLTAADPAVVAVTAEVKALTDERDQVLARYKGKTKAS
jgi:hypothetical protein